MCGGILKIEIFGYVILLGLFKTEKETVKNLKIPNYFEHLHVKWISESYFFF